MKLQLDRLSNATLVQERLFAGLKDESLNFLTSSAGLVRLIDKASRDDCTLEDAAQLVHNEPLVSAKLVAMANSAAYSRSDRSVTNVKDALSVVGLGMLKAVASALIMSQLAGRAAKANELTVSRLWAHSMEVAALAAVIARRCTNGSPETALFAGIVHEIAGFYVLSKVDQLVDLTGGDVIGTVRRDVADHEESAGSLLAVGTRRLLAALKIPDEVTEAIEGQWRGYLMLPPETLSDTLLVANLMATTPSPFDLPGEKAAADGLDLSGILDKSEVAAVVRLRYEEVRSIQQVFNQRPG